MFIVLPDGVDVSDCCEPTVHDTPISARAAAMDYSKDAGMEYIIYEVRAVSKLTVTRKFKDVS
jgi:hypothetical protein